jgi:hypothetical protein
MGKINFNNLIIPKFIDKSLLTKEQKDDPDYRLKVLERDYNLKNTISCSKCHHCR